MYFRILHDEVADTMSYLLADLDAGSAVLIDPRSADLPVLRAMLDEHRLTLRWVLRTHEHDGQMTREADALRTLGAPCVSQAAPEDNDGFLAFGSEHMRVIATPGQTPGCLSFLWRDRLFCGGLMAVDTCPYQARPALPEALWDSVVHKVFTLPSETLLFSNHAHRARAVSNVLEQRRWHPWFAGVVSRDEFLSRVTTPDATA